MALTDFWIKQGDEPIDPDILWARPEQKKLAGRVSIVGGSKSSFRDVSALHSQVLAAGIGEVKTFLPNILEKVLGENESFIYVPANGYGEFGDASRVALAAASSWSDTLIVSPDFGSNSEAIKVLRDVGDHVARQVLVGSSTRLYKHDGGSLINNNHVAVVSLTELRDLAVMMGLSEAFTSGLGNFEIALKLKTVSEGQNFIFVLLLDDIVMVAIDGKVLSKALIKPDLNTVAAYVAVLLEQSSDRPLEAVSAALHLLSHN